MVLALGWILSNFRNAWRTDKMDDVGVELATTHTVYPIFFATGIHYEVNRK